MKTNKVQVIAFYLPQYHPTPENNQWYGEGFTEWTNVGKTIPLFKGHYQPKVPADLGYYDLRLPQTRQLQADLAKEAGITAFCYYHYWFGNGKRMLHLPFDEVVKSKEPDFPFCLCWANHTWYNKMWDSSVNVLNKKVLIQQSYGGVEDIDSHFYSLLDAFKDERYYKIEDKLVFVLYRIENIPNVDVFMDRWQYLASIENIAPFYFVSYVDDENRLSHQSHQLCASTVVSCKSNIDSLGTQVKTRKLSRFIQTMFSQLIKKPLRIYEYKNVRKKLISPLFKDEKIFPTLIPNWDNTPRRGSGAVILKNSTPKQFELHCKEVFENLENKEKKIVFLKSWNEWGEGNYIEPCLKYGKGYIDALRNSLKL